MPNSRMIANNWVDREQALSTRSSVHPHTKYAPIDVTLATAGTAQALYTVAFPDPPAVNIVTNPSMETGAPPTGYTASGATLAQSATVARTGTNSLRITPNNVAAGEGGYWTVDPIGGGSNNDSLYMIASSYFNDNVGSGNGARVEIRSANGVTTLATGNTVTLAANWTGRSSTAYRIPPEPPVGYRVYLVSATQFPTVFYTDSFQIELHQGNSAPTAYIDGSVGIDHEWFGTAHASESRRRAGIHVVRGMSIHVSRDTYIAFDQTLTSTAAVGFFLRAGSDWWSDHLLDIRTRISFVNANVGELPRVTGVLYGHYE